MVFEPEPAGYDLDLPKAVARIRESGAKTVCIQLPEGLKPQAGGIVQELERQTGATVITWLGSCYGACDVPLHAGQLGVDLLIQWGHQEWV
jgi:2-(3-amino-3-carboxypropyl)histidine synthase